MPDRHKATPLSLRLPEALSAWVATHAAERGIPVRRVIIEAIQQAKERATVPCADRSRSRAERRAAAE